MHTSLRRGFTIAELIIVMMIIVLLVAILLPALSSARRRAKKVAAQAQLASILAACESYQLANFSVPGYIDERTYASSGALRSEITASEGLVLSLLGGGVSSGGWPVPGLTPEVRIDVDKIGTGETRGKQYGPYYSPKPEELVAITGTFGNQNTVVELVDIWSGMPILYYRAISGKTVPVGNDENGAGKLLTFSNADFLYSTAITTAYGETIDVRNNSLLSLTASPDANKNLAFCAVSEKLSNGATSPNDADDVLKGSYFLMSGGEDGIYLNKAQGASIANYDDLDNYDDLWTSGG